MANVPRVFVDTSVFFAALWSESSGFRLILKLGESGLIRILVSRRVLDEAEGVLKRKAQDLLPAFALFLERCVPEISPTASSKDVLRLEKVVGHPGDAQIAADAERATPMCLVTLDKAHLLGNRKLAAEVGYKVLSPGDFLSWFRESLL